MHVSIGPHFTRDNEQQQDRDDAGEVTPEDHGVHRVFTHDVEASRLRQRGPPRR